MTIGERIKARRKELGISAETLAKALGKNRATIYRYESDFIENMPTTVLEPLARALYTTPAELMGWEESEEEKSNDSNLSSFLYIHVPVGISAGSLENIDGLTALPRVSIPDMILGKYARDPRIVMMHVNGESMNRVIENGATIAVMTGIQRDQLSDGDIVVACVGPSYTVKRFYNVKEKESIVLSPDSTDPTFVPIIISYDSPDSLRIFGKVVMYSVIL